MYMFHYMLILMNHMQYNYLINKHMHKDIQIKLLQLHNFIKLVLMIINKKYLVGMQRKKH